MTTQNTTTETDTQKTYCVQATRTEFSWVYLKAESEEEAEELAEKLNDNAWKYADYSEERTIDYAQEQEPASWEEVTEPTPEPEQTPCRKPLHMVIAEHVDRGRLAETEATLKQQQEEPASKTTYRVVATSHQAFHIFVEAESDDEAYEIGKEVDGFYWEPTGLGDWEVDSAEPAPDTTPNKLLPADGYNTL